MYIYYGRIQPVELLYYINNQIPCVAPLESIMDPPMIYIYTYDNIKATTLEILYMELWYK